MAHPSQPGPTVSQRSSDTGLFRLFIVVLLTGLAVCLFDLADGQIFLGDIDDQMRAVQIRHLLLGGGTWWDLGLPAIATPEPYISPWSRLVDLPYLLIFQLLNPFLGAEQALSAAFHVWPLVMLSVFCLQCAFIYCRMGIADTLFGHMLVVAATILMAFAIWEFAPGRIDHHNVQILTLMTIACGLVRWGRVGGVMIGGGSLMSLVVALEGLPFVVVVHAALVGALVLRVEGAAVVIRWASATMFFLAAPIAFGLLGPVGMLSTQCDAFSAPYILLIMGLGGILWAVSFLHSAPVWMQVAAMVIPAIVVIAVFTALFPQCLSGPYWMIDPVTRNYWFGRIAQEQDFLFFIEQGRFAIVLLAVILASVITFAAAVISKHDGRNASGLVILLILAWSSLILTLILNRYIRFAFAFAPLFIPLVAQFFVGNAAFRLSKTLQRVTLGCVAGYGALAISLVLGIPAKVEAYDAADYMSYDRCENADFSVLGTIQQGRTIAPLALGMPMLNVLPPGFSVAAIPFHRASPGMKRMFEAFLTSDPAVRRDALAPFDYVAVCRFPLKTDKGTAPLYDALSAGDDWPGLIRLPTGADNPLQLFRIDHAALQ